MSDEPFLEARTSSLIPGQPAILGCPLDRTATFRKGCGAATGAIRSASDSIETYSPLLDMDLTDISFSDLGDLELHGDSTETGLDKISAAVSEILTAGAKPLCLGGEHTVTLGILRALERVRSDYVVVHLDAHSDLRDEYEGMVLNHATVIRRVVDLIGPQRLIQLGIRSGTRPEFRWMQSHGTLMHWEPGAEKTLLQRVASRPVYLTLDLDVLDPSCLMGTGNPEAGGWFYKDMERFLTCLARTDLVGCDVVELNPSLDASQCSSIVSAKIVRELLLLMAATQS